MQHTIDRDTHTASDRTDTGDLAVITEAQLTGLPDVVRRYLHHAQVIGKEPIRTVHLKQTGAMRIKPGGRWFPMVGEQHFTTDPPAFAWRGSIRLLPLVSLSGTDILRDGQGRFRIALLDRIPLVDDSSPEIVRADLLRYLAEIVWFPTAWLSDAITWEGIDDASARATLRYRDQSVSAVMHFDASGELTRVSAERPRKDGKRSVPTPWGGRNSAYREMHGLLIPTRCEVAWQLASGEFAYFRAEVTAIAYNEPSAW